MHSKTVSELALGLSNGEFSSVELTQHFINRTKTLDKQFNAFITLDEEGALLAAEKADNLRQKNSALPLTGIPIAHKDIFCTKGLKTSCGSKMLDNFVAPYNATIVEKLHQAGLISIGKTNMDEFAMGSSNETSFYGTTQNPWDIKAVPGGSSGGSAAAIAGGLIPAATATDTGGSIRQPAAFCGITGIKPTYGRVSRYGMIAFASSLDQAGIMAKTAEDCALLLEIMSGFDEKDSTCLNEPVPQYQTKLNESIEGLTIGLPKPFFNQLSNEMGKIIDNAIATLKNLGATFKEVELPNVDLSIPAYYIIAPAECSSNLARFDGVRYGYRCQNPKDLEDLYKRSRSEGFGHEVKRRIMIGTYVLSSGYYDAYYLKAQKIRTLISNSYQEAFKDVDLLLSPTTPTTAFNIGEKANDPVSMYLNDIYTSSVNLAGLPALSMPGGFINHLPVGIQLIGNRLDEAKLLNVAHLYQQQTNWHRQCPKISQGE